MSYLDTGQASRRQEGLGWWLASDGLWYSPELHPDFVSPGGGGNQLSTSPVATATATMPFQSLTGQSQSLLPSRARRLNRFIVPAVILVVVVVVAAVTVSVEGSSAGWTDSSVHVVGSPIVAGGNVIVLDVTKAHNLEFSAINPSNGAVVWRRPVSASAITPGVSFGPIAVGATVLGLTPSGSPQNPNVFLQGISAVSGKVTWSVPGSALVSDAPGVCPGGRYFCVAGYTSDTATALVALDPTSGNVVAAVNGPERNMGVFALGSSVLEGGLWETSASTPTFMEVSNTGTPLWTKTVANIFGSNSYDPNYGWAFAQRGPLEVGFVGNAPVGNTLNLGDAKTVGIADSTGAVAWSVPGDYMCGGGLQFITTDIVCRYSGTVQQGHVSAGFSTVKLVLEGLNPGTGGITWSLPVNDAEALSAGTNVAFTDGTHLVVHLPSGRTMLLDLKSGRTTPVPSGETFWCAETPTYKVTTPQGSPDPGQRVSAPVFKTCTASGSAAGGQPTSTPPTVGVTTGGLFVWPTLHGLRAAKL